MSAIFTWLTPAAPAAIALLRCPRLPLLLDRPAPDRGRSRFARLLGPDGGVVDEVVATGEEDGRLQLAVHGGPGQRAAVAACLRAHGLEQGPAADLPPHWEELAAAAHPAAIIWLLAHRDGPTPFRRELLFRQPLVLIAGPVNAGKSSLLNAWCGRSRAIVSSEPGTTRDLVCADCLVRGWRLRLADSAGEGPAGCELERAGQDLAARARERADLVLYLLGTGGRGPQDGDLVVQGKADIPPQEGRHPSIPGTALPWTVQGLPGRRVEDLLDALGRAVLSRLALPDLLAP